MQFNILNRWSGDIQFTATIGCAEDAPTALKIGLSVRWAYETGADLRDADLRGAYLGGAYLRGADLRDADLGGANLRGADLGDANLRDANLRGAYLGDAYLGGAYLRGADLSGANLRGADLSDADLRGADLGGANLRGADLGDANLRDADLRGAYLGEILETVPLIPNIDAAILAAIEKNKAAKVNGFDMSSWHGKPCDETNWCQTTHCRAGYAICLAGKEGFELERKYGSANAGMFLYLKSTPNEPIPDWGATNERAMADMKARAAKQTGAA